MKMILRVLVVCLCCGSGVLFADQIRTYELTDSQGNTITVTPSSGTALKVLNAKKVISKDGQVQSASGNVKIDIQFNGSPVVLTGESLLVK